MIKILPAILVLSSVFAFTYCANKNQTACLPVESHGKSAAPNYSIVFPNDKVNRIDIKIDAEQWAEMQADLKSNTAETPHRMPPPDKNQNSFSESEHERRPVEGPLPVGQNIENEGNHPHNQTGRMGPPPGGRQGGKEYEPVWQYCDVYFNNQKWSKVGIRFKGNSSLHFAAQMGIEKLSFKLDFDEFEDEFPEAEDQRFYGFKQLNLKNNFLDNSFVHEKVASDLFREFGIVSPQTAFYQVYVDFGEGEKYYGLYTMVEEVDDTVLKSNYAQSDGNLYKPEWMAGTFSTGNLNKQEFNEKSNKKGNDYSDVQRLYEVINSSKRTTDYSEWRNDLETIFNVSVFLKWLAANTVIQNWDTYGKMSHNYYLYHNPETDKLEWIPWDNNEAFQESKRGKALSLSLNEVNENWPLIRYILDDEEWKTEYKNQVVRFSEDYFNPERMKKTYDKYMELLFGFVVGELGEKPEYSFLRNDSDFFNAIDFLKKHVNYRKIAVQEYLEEYSVSLN